MSTPQEAASREDATSSQGQSELDLGVLSTGSHEVDAALRPLEGLGERPVTDHPEVYELVLQRLTETMVPDEEPAEAPDQPPVGD